MHHQYLETAVRLEMGGILIPYTCDEVLPLGCGVYLPFIPDCNQVHNSVAYRAALQEFINTWFRDGNDAFYRYEVPKD